MKRSAKLKIIKLGIQKLMERLSSLEVCLKNVIKFQIIFKNLMLEFSAAKKSNLETTLKSDF